MAFIGGATLLRRAGDYICTEAHKIKPTLLCKPPERVLFIQALHGLRRSEGSGLRAEDVRT
jgi:hypothetical protein